ncbi:RHS repeat-associated core domain-containing protein [Frankia sp. R43]|uniref:RHS repeat-associated core domain-containing protein n=1 Tax=Frankia sp. R43 TaxID=269536 RepID=UPI001F2E6D8D|nr:RHS repeat-associated core domain-containing protein [Frankia sp. R43]
MATITQFLPAVGVASAAPAENGKDAPQAPAERPDLVTAQLAARAEQRRIEVTSLTTESTRTLVNPNGSITVESASGVVRVQRDGRWQPVDTTLVLVDGEVTPKAAKATIALSGGGGKPGADVATLTDGDRDVAFAWPAALPVPELKDNVALYKGVAKDTDLRVKVTPTGYDVQIVAHTPAAAQAALRLPMRLKGVTAERTSGGELRLSAGGKLAARSPTPLMWDAHLDPKTGLPDRTRTVDAVLERATTATPALALRPDKAWLTAKDRQYPVTIDPAAVLPDNLDTDVVSTSATTNYDTYEYLRVGNAFGSVHRSFLRFDTSGIDGKHVTAAALKLTQAGGYTCTPQRMVVQGSGGLTSGTTWNTQPTADGINWSDTTFNAGGFCGSADVSLDITGLAQAWATNATPSPETLTLRAPDEVLWEPYKFFASGDTTTPPRIETTYNSYPSTVGARTTSPCSAQCGGTPPTVLTNSTTPRLAGSATDADGGTVRLDFEVWNSAGTTKITQGSSGFVTQNSEATWTVPSGLLTNGTSYQWRVRAYDGTDYSQNWSTWIPFTIDTTAPAAPTALASTAWPSGGWASATSGTFTWTSPGGDTAAFLYGLDEPSPTTSTTATTSASLTADEGLHTFYLRTLDTAGNLSPVISYNFGVGNAALASPAEQSRTQRFATLRGEAPSSQVSVTYRYRVGTNPSTAWTDVPTAETTTQGTTSHPTWPAPRNGAGTFDNQIWNIPGTLGGGSDGPIQIEACFRTTAAVVTCTDATTIQFTRNAFSDTNATADVGPGSLALLTGDYSLSAIDVSMPTYTGTLTVGRTLSTLTPAAATTTPSGIFGPGWTSNIPGPDTGAGDRTLTDNTATEGFVTVTSPQGAPAVYTRSGTGSYPFQYTGVADTASDGSKLVKDSATKFTLTQVNGAKTIWYAKTVSGSTIWVVDRVEEPGSNTTSTFTTDAQGRVTRILGPVPDGVDCSGTLGAGCRALTLTYATSTTATGASGSSTDWGNYTGQVSSVSMALNGTTPIEVARYSYDNTGHLRAAWDPRLDTPAGNHLATLYWYNAQGRIQGYIPTGEETWGFDYDSFGRLFTVTRPRPAGAGTATRKIVYNIALSGGSAPINMAPTAVDDWGQQDLPAWSVALFPASHVPSDPPTGADWPYADILYLNSDGRQVNTASYGAGAWQVTTIEHDQFGNPVRELSAENRNQALVPTADTDPTVAALTDSATRAQLLDTDTIYSVDGVVPVDEYGPTHRYINNSGVRSSVRQHVHTDYDEGAPPSAEPYRLPTTITTAAWNGSTDADPRKTINGYAAKAGADPATSGWVLHQPTTVASWMGGGSTPDIVRTTYFNTAGQALESRQPKANAAGTDAFTTVYSYFAPTGTGGCVNASWAGLTCSTGPAAQPTSGNPLPVKTYTYNNLNDPLAETETITSGTTTTRTTTNTYDTAGRLASKAVAVTPAANGGVAIPATTYGYSTTTGLPTTTTANSITLTTSYDTWGQVTSQSDADGNTTTTTYDIDGQTSSVDDGKGTYAYTYDTATEHRGLVTSLGVGAGAAPSTFTATYNGDSQPTTQTYPNGILATTRYNNIARPTTLTYTKGASTWMTFTQIDNIQNQARVTESPSGAREHLYDAAGRLGVVRDVRNDTGTLTCTSRRYVYDADSNRTQHISYPDAGTNPTGPACSTTTTPTYSLSSSYDQADRITDTGYAYDSLGRTTTVPAAHAGGTALTVGYHANDMIASEVQGATTRTYALDPAQRVRAWTQGATTWTNHYSTDSGDSASWIGQTGGAWTRNISGITGTLAAVQDNTGAVTLQLTNLHGDIVATVDNSTSVTAPASFQETWEFGQPYNAAAAFTRYGWLGGPQRSRDTLSGISLMGVRLYNPYTGRFLSVDPVQGGSDNPYEYARQDPYNNVDLTGEAWRTKFQEPFTLQYQFHGCGCNPNMEYRAIAVGIARYLPLGYGTITISHNGRRVVATPVGSRGGTSRSGFKSLHKGYNYISLSVRLLDHSGNSKKRQIFHITEYI